MGAAILLYLGAAALGIVLGSLLPFANSRASGIAKDAIILVLVIAAYKVLIARLGEQPRDDLRLAGSLAELGKGILAGLLIFTAIVGIAFGLGVYKIVGEGDPSRMVGALVGVALLPAFTEELLFAASSFAGSRNLLAAGQPWA